MVILNCMGSQRVLTSAIMISRELEQNEGILVVAVSSTGSRSCAEAESRKREITARTANFMAEQFFFYFSLGSNDRAEKKDIINSQKLYNYKREINLHAITNSRGALSGY